MSDSYERNNHNSVARQSIESLLRDAGHRIDSHPEGLPFKPIEGRMVIAWLRALCDRKPSELK